MVRKQLRGRLRNKDVQTAFNRITSNGVVRVFQKKKGKTMFHNCQFLGMRRTLTIWSKDHNGVSGVALVNGYFVYGR